MTAGSPSRTLRAFLAIPLPETIKSGLIRIQKELATELPNVRWVKPDGMHLTLKFFGDIPEESLEKIGAVMLSVKLLTDPFPAAVSGIGAFPSAGKPRVIWAGFHAGSPLTTLQAALEEGFSRIGIPREDRPFTPHLTLGRCRSPHSGAAEILDKYRAADCGTLQVERLILYESRLLPAGALHRPLRTLELG